MTFAVSAAVFEAHVLPYPHLAGRYMQLLADVIADAVHHALTVRAAFLCVGMIVFDPLAPPFCGQRAPAPRVSAAPLAADPCPAGEPSSRLCPDPLWLRARLR